MDFAEVTCPVTKILEIKIDEQGTHQLVAHRRTGTPWSGPVTGFWSLESRPNLGQKITRT